MELVRKHVRQQLRPVSLWMQLDDDFAAAGGQRDHALHAITRERVVRSGEIHAQRQPALRQIGDHAVIGGLGDFFEMGPIEAVLGRFALFAGQARIRRVAARQVRELAA
ncbi:hypothetical protein ACTJI2_06695 [Pseudoxanthomonas sp. 22568]|uniref:hypothetical protein n=1 Tax=Pseudoxanthomonas sp. 22568 TaxID=3453945 RepID=UPI003F83A56D